MKYASNIGRTRGSSESFEIVGIKKQTKNMQLSIFLIHKLSLKNYSLFTEAIHDLQAAEWSAFGILLY